MHENIFHNVILQERHVATEINFSDYYIAASLKPPNSRVEKNPGVLQKNM